MNWLHVFMWAMGTIFLSRTIWALVKRLVSKPKVKEWPVFQPSQYGDAKAVAVVQFRTRTARVAKLGKEWVYAKTALPLEEEFADLLASAYRREIEQRDVQARERRLLNTYSKSDLGRDPLHVLSDAEIK